ncbi:hypothetical protein E2C01_085918 [Portunus trituberculatus]|uniref:Uncharacterized protein n=1 Tax=Portunus trituberculatus TaxID=210409 RepID=A0A5B7JEY2_PORTR|nr:hypothetical protein [Portunus trituberculatus]
MTHLWRHRELITENAVSFECGEVASLGGTCLGDAAPRLTCAGRVSDDSTGAVGEGGGVGGAEGKALPNTKHQLLRCRGRASSTRSLPAPNHPTLSQAEETVWVLRVKHLLSEDAPDSHTGGLMRCRPSA